MEERYLKEQIAILESLFRQGGSEEQMKSTEPLRQKLKEPMEKQN